MNKKDANCVVMLFTLIFLYTFENIPYLNIKNKSIYVYLLKPLMWIVIAFIFYRIGKIKIKLKHRQRANILWWVFFLSLFYVSTFFFCGFFIGFGKTPYDVSPYGILKNTLLFFSPIFSRELIRSYLVNRKYKRSEIKAVVWMSLLVIFMTLINIPLSKFYELKGGLETVMFLSQTLLPELTKNILATYLVSIGGSLFSIIYLCITEGVFFISPILPDLNWIISGLISTLFPIFILMFLQYIYGLETRTIRKEKNENPLSLITTSLISVLIIWFVIGVFPVRPYTILTGSMEPLIKPGDVVLVKRNSDGNIKIGDIVQYKSENIFIFHRIIDEVEKERVVNYKTKGDNNSVPDSELVPMEDIKGTVIKVIPKVGWPTLFFRSKFNPGNTDKSKVEF